MANSLKIDMNTVTQLPSTVTITVSRTLVVRSDIIIVCTSK